MAKFRPTLIPTVFTIPALILLLALGSWQVKRMQWKNHMVADIKQHLVLPATDIPAHVTIDTDQYKKVKITGEYPQGKEIFLYTGPRDFEGKAGYDVLAPLKRTDGSYVLVDRGWIPLTEKNSPRTFEKITVEGVIMKGEKKGYFTPENDTARNMWFWIDIPEAARYFKLDLPPYYIMQQESADKKVSPRGRVITVDSIRNDHLQYAITWYSAAFSLLVIYVIYHRKKG